MESEFSLTPLTQESSISFKSQESVSESSIEPENNLSVNWKSVFEEAMLSLKLDDNDRSHTLFSKSLDLGTTSYPILDKRAKVYFRIGRFKDSLHAAERMIELEPDNYRGYYRAGRTLYRLGNSAALNMYKRAQELYDESIKNTKPASIQEQSISERISTRRRKLERLQSNEDDYAQSKRLKSGEPDNRADSELTAQRIE